MQDEVRHRPSATSFSFLGDLFIGKGDTARAAESHAQALRRDPSSLTALYNLSVLSAARGDIAAARVLAERAYQLRPDIPAVKELYFQLNPRRSR